MKQTRRHKDKETRGLFSPFLLILSFLLPPSSFLLSLAFAVTYNTDPANGPETLSAEVTESFEAWKALDDKLEVSPVTEKPESLFQYGAAERFSPDTLSITVQRQEESRQLLHLINPNIDNRKRVLLHETGIAIGLNPQNEPGSQSADNASNVELETRDTTTPEASSDTQTESTSDNTDATTENTDPSTSETTDTSTTTENTDESTDTNSENTDESTNQSQGSESQEETSDTTTESSQEESTDTPSETTETSQDTNTETLENATPATTIKPWQTVMNPSVTPDDRAELGEGEKALLKILNLFAKEDINKDGNINFYDLVAISQALGQRNVNDPSDVNKDGIVNQTDVDLLRKAYTFSDPASTPPNQSPENPEGQTGPENPEPPLDDGSSNSDTNGEGE